jgi:DedD protein
MSGSPPKARGGWTVQVGSFSNEANARKLSAKLRNQRFPASVEPIKVNDRISYRVRVGKQASRAASEKMLARMEQETGVTGKVMSIGN